MTSELLCLVLFFFCKVKTFKTFKAELFKDGNTVMEAALSCAVGRMWIQGMTHANRGYRLT